MIEYNVQPVRFGTERLYQIRCNGEIIATDKLYKRAIEVATLATMANATNSIRWDSDKRESFNNLRDAIDGSLDTVRGYVYVNDDWQLYCTFRKRDSNQIFNWQNCTLVSSLVKINAIQDKSSATV